MRLEQDAKTFSQIDGLGLALCCTPLLTKNTYLGVCAYVSISMDIIRMEKPGRISNKMLQEESGNCDKLQLGLIVLHIVILLLGDVYSF